MRRFVPVLPLAALACVAALAVAPAGMAADRCLRGQWRMPNERANTFLQNLIGNPAMRVKSGVLTAAFDATDARYAPAIEVASAVMLVGIGMLLWYGRLAGLSQYFDFAADYTPNL